MDCSMPGFPVHHHLPELATHIHWVGDAIHWVGDVISSPVVPFSSCPQSFPESGSFSMSQEAKVLELQLQDQYFQWIFRVDFLYWLAWSPCSQGALKSIFQHHSSKASVFSAQPSLWCNSHIHTWLLVKPYLWLYGPLSAKGSLLPFSTLPRLVIAFLPRSKRLLIS